MRVASLRYDASDLRLRPFLTILVMSEIGPLCGGPGRQFPSFHHPHAGIFLVEVYGPAWLVPRLHFNEPERSLDDRVMTFYTQIKK